MISKPQAGPIARKIVNALSKPQKQKLVDLAIRRKGADEMERIHREAVASDDARNESPSFAAYTNVTNWALALVEAIQEMPELRRFMDRIQKAEDEYMPSGPPMSPLTKSFFWSWALWDLTVGVKHETLGSIVLAVARSRGMDPSFVDVLSTLVESRLGLHVHAGVANGRIQLRELVTDELRVCSCQAGYDGVAGELWLARVLPASSAEVADHVVVTTPYVIVNPGVEAWRKYLARTLANTGKRENIDAYRVLMKRDWSEYVFEAYASHRTEAIFLLGLPDVAESRPHSRVNADRESELGAAG